MGVQAQGLPSLASGTANAVGSAVAVPGGAMVPISDGSVIDMSGIPADNLVGLGSGSSPDVFVGGIPEPEEKLASLEKKQELDYEACPDDDNDGVCNTQDYCSNTPAKAVVLPSGCHLSRDAPLELVGVFFDFNGTSLRPESFEILDRVVAVLRQQFNVVVEIGGHSDSRGNRETNRKVSEARAKAVYDYLINRGIAPYRLRFKGYGESQPVAANKLADGEDFAAGRARNRRVDLRVVSDLAEAGSEASRTN
ncbi:outer membrane protein OmpA-like peptidoglycan-associated protein [Litorivivens lipolytica]|uniref:Outer membrane protein OmpA-like peptidoglycan-associated protein n=1 Tax=Litorivivens lipolytica TaxID=1524264 RepID=A0A7W4Z5L8_9GAMM|nr:outer membrane protein OmpA-like peptidoglycan-associated protein [Litorivivens lipolytica]